MTARKHFKQLVRARMQKTGESYATARRHTISRSAGPDRDPTLRWHFPGSIPATTGLRVLLSHAGVTAPHTGQPYSEALLFGIAGGIGIGVFAFFYEKEQFASFFVAGRHLWQDDLAYLTAALGRFGVKPAVKESSGEKTAEKQLREALAVGPCIAWVDAASLPHRAMPPRWSGSGYHVVTVYRIDDDAATATIGDLTDEPVSIRLSDLAVARGRIQKQKNRLLWLDRPVKAVELPRLVREGLRACHEGLRTGGRKSSAGNFQLEALRSWAERMVSNRGKDSWEVVFAGPRLWTGLTSLHDFVEHYGTGGGLCRPLFEEFLTEAAEATGDARLRALAGRYAELARLWSELADAALPDDVPLLRQAKELYARKAELLNEGASADEVRAVWDRLADVERQARERFPLSPAESAELRSRLSQRVLKLYEGEVAAQKALGELLD